MKATILTLSIALGSVFATGLIYPVVLLFLLRAKTLRDYYRPEPAPAVAPTPSPSL